MRTPLFTKKHFEVIENRLKKEFHFISTREKEITEEKQKVGISWARASLVEFGMNMANDLEKINPAFNREKFLQACGITE